MGKYKICVYAISKNEEPNVDLWVDSMSEADKIVVLDTGSTDNTVEKFKKRNVMIKSQIFDPWRFDAPRNVAMSMIPKDYDICVCTDIDERFEKGWREELEKIWTPDTKQVFYNFYWCNNTAKSFFKEKIHSRNGFKWIKPVHEILEFDNLTTYKKVYANNITLVHYQLPKTTRANYLPLLELSVQENPNDDRNMHYLGREYMYYGFWDKCINTLTKHLKMPNATWVDERSNSMRFIGNAFKAKKDFQNAESWYLRAIAEAPHLREPYLSMANFYQEIGFWQGVVHMVEEALKINVRTNAYLIEEKSWGYYPYDLGSLGYFHMGLYQKSYEYCLKALEFYPDNERIKNNLELIKNYL